MDPSIWLRLPDAGGEVDHALIAQPILATLAERVRRQPERVAVADARRSFSYRQLWALAQAYGQAIIDAGAGPGPVGLLVDGDARYAVGLLAGLFAGRACLPLDAATPAPRLAEMLGIARAGLVLASRDDAGMRAAAAGLPLVVAPADAAADSGGLVAAPGGGDQDAPAFILATSGSSGRPKLVVHSQRTIAHRGFYRMTGAGSTQEDRLMLVGAPAAYATISHIFGTLFAGAAGHLIDMRQEGIGALFARMERERITVLRAGPSLGRVIAGLDGARGAMAHLRLIWLAGEPPTREDIALLRAVAPAECVILNGYGATEMVSFRWFVPAGSPSGWGEAATGPLPVGMPDGGAQAVLLRDDGTACGPGEAGELVVRSRYNALGECEDGVYVLGRLVPDPAAPGCRVYFSGDIARRQADGSFVVLGRRDRMIKINGQRFEPMEVETALRGHAGVRDAVVLPRAQGKATGLVAFVAAGGDPDPGLADGLQAALRRHFPAYMVPSRLVVLARLPRLPSGKVDAAALLAGLAD